MPGNAALASSTSSAIKSKHSAMATFDNPSYFTISSQTGVTSAAIETPDAGAKTKKFKNWFKLSKRAFRSKASLNDPAAESDANNLASDTENHDMPKPGSQQLDEKRELPDVVYYNFTPAIVYNEEVVNDDDVFSEECANRSRRTLNRRRHSLGSWFRSSLAVVRKNQAASTGSGLEASGLSRSAERPSTSSERALLSRHVSASAHCVSYTSSRDAQTPEAVRPTNPPVSKSAESKANKRPRLPVSIKSTVELRARARYARQEKLMRSDGAVRSSASASRVPRSAQSPRRQTASLDRRYTNSTEVLASKSEESGSALPGPSRAANERDEENSREDSNSLSRRRNLGGSASFSALIGRQQRFVARSRTIEDRSYRTSCCGRAAAAVAVSSCHRRRTSIDNSTSSQLIRRRCPRCRDKAEPINAKKVDVVIIFSKNCLVAPQWISYLTSVLNNIFINEDRSSTRVTYRDVESLVHCDSQLVPSSQGATKRNFARSDYENDSAAEQLEVERSSSQRAIRKTVETASLQIVLLSKPLLRHIGQHANDPLGQLLHPNKVIGLLLGLDESKDITPLHISALYSYSFWPKIVMLDQNIESVGQFRQQAIDILSRSQSTATKDSRRFKLTPKKLRPGEERVTVLLHETTDGIQRSASVHVALDLTDNPIHVQRLSWLNPYTFSFDVPREFIGRGITVRVQLKVNGTSWGINELKCQSKLSEISRLLDRAKCPLDVMCSALNISPSEVEKLDKTLANELDNRKIPLAGHFRSVLTEGQSNEEFPTLMHFAARFGLRQFFWALLESCPFALSALNIQNRQGMTASKLADANGHHLISNDLKSIIEVMEKDGNVYLPDDLAELYDEEEEDYVLPSGQKTYSIKGNQKTGSRSYTAPTPTDKDDYVAPSHGDGAVYENTYDDHEPVEDKRRCLIKKLSADLLTAVESEPSRGYNGNIFRLTQTAKMNEQGSLKHQNLNTPKGSTSLKGSDNEEGAISVPRKLSSASTGGRYGNSTAPSPYTSWASSDRSSVASHTSQDSGTLSESNDERKMRYDYGVPQQPILNKGLSNYLVPPPPRPIKETPSRSNSPKPGRNQHRFDAVEFSPPPSQNALGEDLGRILPNEEPLIFEQTSIPLSKVEERKNKFNCQNDDYIFMNPSESTPRGADDDYLRSDEINAPTTSAFTLPRRQIIESHRTRDNFHEMAPLASIAKNSSMPARRRNLPPRH